jgi:hypothetical protein
MDYRLGLSGEYITAAEIGEKRPVITVRDVTLVKLAPFEAGEGTERNRWILWMVGKDRGWVVNRTNAECLAAMFGPETDNWKGKRLQLYTTMVQAGRGKELGIRIAGSPDLEKPITVEIKLPRKRPFTVTLLKGDSSVGKKEEV